jgi:selenium-binding protein 1
LTNSLYRTWDEQFYPEGIRGWISKIDVDDQGAMTLDPHCFVQVDGMRPHQVRLEAGDASSDSYCFSGGK